VPPMALTATRRMWQSIPDSEVICAAEVNSAATGARWARRMPPDDPGPPPKFHGTRDILSYEAVWVSLLVARTMLVAWRKRWGS
jgi:hypothetical protein